VNHIFFGVLLLATSAFYALLEVEIEGASGWARNLPTWRLENRWTRLLLGSRPLTGYHLYAWLFLLAAAHLPYAFGAELSLAVEARVAAFVLLFWIVEDFLWFVFNPAYGIRRFRPEHIWWHAPTWWWIMPRDYWLWLPCGVGLYLWGALQPAAPLLASRPG
jgi:hypothetical protein